MLKRGKFLLVFVILFASIIFVEALQSTATTSAKVNVLPLYNLSIKINILNKLVFSGENLLVLVDLKKTDLTKVKSSPRINVNLNYEILKGNKVVKTGFIETIPIIKSDRDTVDIKIPSDFNTDVYALRIIATNPQSYTASDKDYFLAFKRFKFKF